MHASDFLDTKIEYLKGVGPQRAELLRKELGISDFAGLLNHYPFRYVDRSKFHSISNLTEDLPYVQVKGTISRISVHGGKRPSRMTAIVSDGTGQLELVWFKGIRWFRDSIKAGTEYIVFGKPGFFNGRFNMIHPEMEEAAKAEQQMGPSLTGVYSTTEKCRTSGLDSKGIQRLVKTLLLQWKSPLPETLNSDILQRYKLIPLREAITGIHLPAGEQQLAAAQYRLKFDELFFIQLRLLKAKWSRQQAYKGKPVDKIGEVFNVFYNTHLPFELTGAQKRVLKEIRQDMGSGKQMNRLLQGDVGSGKTMVALLSMLMVLDNGYQACLMAPTEILANQHFQSITEALREMDIRVGLLTGSTKSSHRKFLLEELNAGRLQILVGTHALIEDRVQFSNLGLVVIDEQHRFGVQQRARLWKKDELVPHVLVMTATPIPRTLAMTLYGDLDTSVIDELPPGRKPIRTIHRTEDHRLAVFGFLKEEIAKGRQVYIVYPLIEESEKLDYTNLMQGYDTICREFPLPQYQVSIVNGRMKAADKDFEMNRFKEGKAHIMVATTVIEVGVNVPNASVMVIESAERFGLSQLHQLRGRVGRGAEQSFCILMTGSKIGNDARLRMRTMCDTNDGFKIAEVDLELRGPGDLAGTQQSGVLDLQIANLAKDQRILELAREAAIAVLSKDERLMLPENSMLANQLKRMDEADANYSRVS
ncbi:MAG: ATP-dependent DNA helicase RecG [Bacteroidia bacterium]|nr:ATP-dependent DNA helicase RecG [Bacteroidia bacterium]